jgi:hypothetical protein
VNLPRIPRPLARQIDRLARRAHTFHRFAHHPLCDAYRSEVIRMGGRTRFCKGCTFLAIGFVTGILVGTLARPPFLWGAAGILLALLLGGLSLSLRMPKLLGRALPGVGLGMGLWAGWPCALATLLIVGVFGFLYRRRGVERSRCDSCHERQRSPCSGFVLIVRRERAFQRRADRWLNVFRDRSSGNLGTHGGRKRNL